jgi:molecular chaperone DnaK (HSP70)
VTTPIGIDFGTTNSVVAAYSEGGVDVLPIDNPPPKWADLGFAKVFPSVLGVRDGSTATFGWAAKEQDGDKLEAVKRLFATEESVTVGGVEMSVELAAAALFGRLKAGAESSGAIVSRAVVTIPANSRGVARSRTKVCAGLAGIEVAALLNEPTAAAMAHSISAADDQTILVFDWGGGTLDVTVLETVAGVFMERASKGIQRSGGIDLDDLFLGALVPRATGHDRWSRSERTLFRNRVELAKVLLSSQADTNIELPGGGYLNATRQHLEQAIRPRIVETRGPIEQCLRDLRIDSSAIDHVVLVGGSSKIPAVRAFVSEVLGKEPAGGVDPMTAVAEGAAIAAAIMADQLDSDFFVGTEHALGTVVLNDQQDDLEFSTIIPRNHSLPAKATNSYKPVSDHQESVKIRVVEGDPEVAIDHADNVILKEWTVPIDRSRAVSEAGFDIVFEYDVDGILHVRVVDQKTGDEMLRDDVSFGVTGDKAGLVRTARELQDILRTGRLGGATADAATTTVTAPTAYPLDPISAASIDRARTKVIPFVDDAEAKRLEALCRDVEGSSAGDIAIGREALDAACRQYAYLYS